MSRSRLFQLIPIACALPLAASAGAPAAASAGTYQVRSCNDAQSLPGTKADDAWQPGGDGSSAFTFTRSCPSNGAQFSGVAMEDKLMLPFAERPLLNQVAEWRLDAPSGTTITHVRVQRDIGIGSNSMRPYGRTADGTDIDATCTITGENFTCDVGGPATPYFEADVDTTAVRWGIECHNTGTRCTTGSTLHNAWAMIYGSTVTIDDPTAPTLTAVGGPLLSGGWKRGTVDATATASDTTGIRRFRFYEGATQRAEIDRTCDYSRTVPCANPAAGASVGFDTTVLSDGSHTIALAAVDAAGNETRSADQTIDVDNTAPAAPTGLTVSGGGASPGYGVAFAVPGGQVSPVTAAGYRICPAGGTCVTGSVPVTGASGSITGQTAAAGTSTIEVWLVDAAGNGGPAHAATTTVTYTPPAGGGGSGGGGGGGGTPPVKDPTRDTPLPTPPAPAPAPVPGPEPADPAPTPPARVRPHLLIATARLARRTGELTVAGTLHRRATGTVTITLRARVDGRRRTTSRTARIRDGAYAATLSLPTRWRQARRARVVVTYAGSAAVARGRAAAKLAGGGRPTRLEVRQSRRPVSSTAG